MRFYGSIQKVDVEQRMVWGYASTEATDRHGEIVLKSAIEDALDDYLDFANIREMHQLSAVGKAVAEETMIDDKGLYVGAKIVDDAAWAKVMGEVYSGFSIGGKVLARDPDDKKIITKIRLDEISLVDRPSNPEARFDVWKAAGSPQEDSMAKLTPVELPKDAKSDIIVKTINDAVAAGNPIIVANSRESDMLKAINDRVTTVTAEEAAEMAKAAQAPEAAGKPVDASSAQKGEGEGAVEKTNEAQDVTAEAGKTAETVEKAAETTQSEAEKPAVESDAITKATAALDKIDAAVANVVSAEDVQKSMYHVSRFADVLESISYLAQSAEYEAEIEADGSPVPGKLRDWIKAGAAIFKDMAKEEVDELVAAGKVKKAAASAPVTVDVSAVGGEALAKTIGDAVDTITAERDALTRTVAERDEILAKLADRIEPLAKTVEDLVATNADLAKRLAAVEDQPAPVRTGGSFAVSKEDDAGASGTLEKAATPSDEDIAKALAAMPEEDRAMLLIKASHQLPQPARFMPAR